MIAGYGNGNGGGYRVANAPSRLVTTDTSRWISPGVVYREKEGDWGTDRPGQMVCFGSSVVAEL